MKDILKNNSSYFPNGQISLPIAEQIVKIIAENKISYAEACEALDIAKIGIGDLTISDI